jgi:hypothetical protein
MLEAEDRVTYRTRFRRQQARNQRDEYRDDESPIRRRKRRYRKNQKRAKNFKSFIRFRAGGWGR